jgi:hypothetical protein
MCAIKSDTPSGDTPGPIPTAELKDPTAAMCQFCLKEAKSPPEPWCCASRRNYILKVECGEHPVFVPPKGK